MPSCFALSRSMWWTLWAVWIIVIGITTTIPWSSFVGHAHWNHVRWIPMPNTFFSLRAWFDVVANIILFLPFGGFTVLACPRFLSPVRSATLLAFILSTGIEFYQIFCHNHFPTSLDIVSNVLGASLGAMVAGRYAKLFSLSAPPSVSARASEPDRSTPLRSAHP